MFAVPTNEFVGRGGSSEALIVAEQRGAKRTLASQIIRWYMVSEQRGRAGRGVVHGVPAPGCRRSMLPSRR